MSEQHTKHHGLKIVFIVLGVILGLLLALFSLILILHVLNQNQQIQSGEYLRPQETSKQLVSNEYQGAQQRLIEGVDNHYIGAEEPLVTIVQFADFACPFCRASFPALREISIRYADTVKIIFRDWPGHDESINLAMSAYCAGEQGKFWEMHDRLYQNQAEYFGMDKNDTAMLAGQIGVYNQQFQTCFDSQKYLPAIRENYRDSVTLGVNGTPTWFINGNKIEGSLTSTEIMNILDHYITLYAN